VSPSDGISPERRGGGKTETESGETMDQQRRAYNPVYTFFPIEVEGFDSLAELALNMRWYWNHAADELWRQLDPVLWDFTYNPWVVLQTISRERLRRVLSDASFRNRVDELLQAGRQEAEEPAWFQLKYPEAPLASVAHFSMEFMLSEALPIYSGGLGNVAGDHLKTASDLGVPVVGVGLLYQQGYFRQVIDRDGAQQALFPYNDPGQLPITPLREPGGEWLRLELMLPGYPLWLRAWQVQVGRLKLYLLDSNDLANFPAHRGITSELYGGGPELRLKQELVLGLGGWRLLEHVGMKPEVCHLNEGHTAFAVLERARSFMEETGQPFEAALTCTRAGTLFTTHTPVDAGFDRFSPALIAQYLGGYARDRLHISLKDLLALGRRNPDDPAEYFNTAYLAMRGSGAANGVSRLHGTVSRRLFQPLFPLWPENEVPIGHITNGVHMPSWDSAESDALWTGACGKERWIGTTESLEQHMRAIPDSLLWEYRTVARRSLVEFVRKRLLLEQGAMGESFTDVEDAAYVFDANALTLGFARRFATYKRPNLLLHDPERLLRLLTNPERPVQLIVAGKAHPEDKPGQAMIQQWTRFIRLPEARKRVAFLSDYDMLLTARLVQGVDVWINTPRRPWEACGTSGMKVLVNGGINLSELDGWWAEAYRPEVGWALGDGKEHGDDPAWDAAEAEALYTLLEDEVVPEFYTRDSNGIPAAWVARIRESMALLTPHFSSNRAVREYTERYYIPLAAAYVERAADKGAAAAEMVNWRHDIERKWTNVRFGEVKVEEGAEGHLFEVQVYLDSIDPDAVHVALYADKSETGDAINQEMTRGRKLVGAENGYVYSARVSGTRPASDYTARVIPHCEGVAVPMETARILWQR
jgi:starch phosphorylase